MEEHHSECCVSSEQREAIIGNIIDQLRQTGMRKSEALEELLRSMLSSHRPFLLSELGRLPGLAHRDQATIYRLVTKLKELGIVRQLNFGEKGNYFQLNLPDHHHDYLLCDHCGRIAQVPYPCVLEGLEEKLRSDLGWKNLSHSLAFHGICPECENQVA